MRSGSELDGNGRASNSSGRLVVEATMRTPDEEVLPLGLAEALPPDQLDRVEVGPLAPDVLHRIVREQIGVTVPRPTLVRIQQASGGNPLFALEIARSVHRAGTRVSGSHMPVPHQIGDIVAERIEALSPAAREQLLVASALANPTIELVTQELHYRDHFVLRGLEELRVSV